ncbi:hypothetical protein H632_c639p1 [Helicosporidium sp. ATCC 50920]|nr:hypothetical protein H632_c639p1 [Helicosporidium sp. ATCC 50920]|eukprot:KDD75522.1 hypothetical protein H632_c639p1 [Helicosporidium sp. ATCC 50920]
MGVRVAACLVIAIAVVQAADQGICHEWDYRGILGRSSDQRLEFAGLPGFMRSVHKPSYALITPESRVWAPLVGWTNTTTAHVISPVRGANFAMYFARMGAGGARAAPPANPLVQRLAVVLRGSVSLGRGGGGDEEEVTLEHGEYVYIPANAPISLVASESADLLVFEKRHKGIGATEPVWGAMEEREVLDVPGEVFVLRKLLPVGPAYDFNVHIMDFEPGQFLYTKEVHYNQHGVVMLEGQGIYRLDGDYHPVQTGDAIWMAPYVPQWYGALGSTPSRYILYKDTMVDPMDLDVY